MIDEKFLMLLLLIIFTIISLSWKGYLVLITVCLIYVLNEINKDK